MRAGRLVQSGHPMDLYRYPDDEQTAHFLGEAVVLPARIEAGWAHCDLGQVPVNSNGFTGAAHIMLRPEQLQIAEVASDRQGCHATVTERDFAGNTCTLTVELSASTTQASARSILVRSTGMHAPSRQFGVPVSARCGACVWPGLIRDRSDPPPAAARCHRAHRSWRWSGCCCDAPVSVRSTGRVPRSPG